MLKHVIFFGCACFLVMAHHSSAQTDVPSKATPEMFKKGYDIPTGVTHGTWDFDEWPGVDRRVVYKENFMYNSTPNEKIKIDYFLSVFDRDDHEGYLKTPEELLGRGFTDFNTILKSDRQKTMIGIFAHPDDEVLLAGGLLAAAAAQNWNVRVFLVSNGADGAEGQSDAPSTVVEGFNSAGIMPDGKVVVKTDVRGEKKLDIIQKYSEQLGVRIKVIPIDLTIEGKKVVQVGEVPGLDFKKTFGAGSEFRIAIHEAIARLIKDMRPSVVLTHGQDGEYGSMLHKYIYDIVKQIASEQDPSFAYDVYTGFPEYNFRDKITHFIDLHANDKQALNRKWNAIKNISFLYTEGADFDKPWDPNDNLFDGVFVKDYGYHPETAEPPRYEYYQKLTLTGK